MYVNMFPVPMSEHKENTSRKSLLLVNSSFVNGFYEKRKVSYSYCFFYHLTVTVLVPHKT